ncbi:hypothetical protein AEAC466_04365 [Asticcacaulis sp. AC466]|uniref:hypothetical protein n=1 Tax=Asticcacaulis sp. AC466 TaxID=1282362 RepID=UPI0003C3D095|nr:hypothetical protein [Asticcacaulis sp. AC466]ESQ85405.1 hypothetical protein AEAC466_04365 [Asticcacaulis sp. AC466]
MQFRQMNRWEQDRMIAHALRLKDVPFTPPSRQQERHHERQSLKGPTPRPRAKRPAKITLRLTRKERQDYSDLVLGHYTLKRVFG